MITSNLATEKILRKKRELSHRSIQSAGEINVEICKLQSRIGSGLDLVAEAAFEQNKNGGIFG
jgi:seryl-tRNA(Sec) selenium transferase